MRNGKEIMFLIIMILVVLVSSAKAEVDPLRFETSKRDETVFFGLNDQGHAQRTVSREKEMKSNESAIKIWVDSPSSLSDISDAYGLVVTISKSF